MAKQFPSLDDRLTRFIAGQHVFFTASAAGGTRVNVSPRSTSAFRVLGGNTVAYLDLTGSGNETAAHLKADGRLTIMFCAFDEPPMILRLYGRGTVLHRDGPEFADLLARHFGGTAPPGTRQIVRLDMDLVQTSCGFAVPFFSYVGERLTLERWAVQKQDQMEDYWRQKNVLSMDGLPTGIFSESERQRFEPAAE